MNAPLASLARWSKALQPATVAGATCGLSSSDDLRLCAPRFAEARSENLEGTAATLERLTQRFACAREDGAADRARLDKEARLLAVVSALIPIINGIQAKVSCAKRS